jgi:uncharacterized membrane protein
MDSVADEQTPRAETFLTEQDISRVEAKISAAEKRTSAEIKVIIDSKGVKDLRKRARKLFKKYGLYRTAQRNGVLILVEPSIRTFLIYGDKGIHEHVGQGFWDEVRDAMLACFKENRIADGLSIGIHLIGEILARFFPHHEGDLNEISNRVAFES